MQGEGHLEQKRMLERKRQLWCVVTAAAVCLCNAQPTFRCLQIGIGEKC